MSSSINPDIKIGFGVTTRAAIRERRRQAGLDDPSRAAGDAGSLGRLIGRQEDLDRFETELLLWLRSEPGRLELLKRSPESALQEIERSDAALYARTLRWLDVFAERLQAWQRAIVRGPST